MNLEYLTDNASDCFSGALEYSSGYQKTGFLGAYTKLFLPGARKLAFFPFSLFFLPGVSLAYV